MTFPVTLVRLLLIIPALPVSLSCDRAQETNQTDAGVRTVSAQSAAGNRAGVRDLIDQDCRRFAQAVTTAVESGDQANVNVLIDWEQVLDRILDGVKISAEQRRKVAGGLLGGIKNKGSFTGRLVDNSKAGGSLDFLRVRQDNRGPLIMLRMRFPLSSGGFDYIDLAPGRSADGKVRAFDVRFLTNGEFISTLLRHMLLPMIAREAPDSRNALSRSDRDFLDDFPRVVKMNNDIIQGKMNDALAIVKDLKPETKRQKAVLLNRLRAAQEVDHHEYRAVLEEFRQTYPEDPCLDLLLIDYYTLKKDFVRTDETIDRLDKAVGGDPSLNLSRASLRVVQGDLAGAEKFAKRAIEEEPTLCQAYCAP